MLPFRWFVCEACKEQSSAFLLPYDALTQMIQHLGAQLECTDLIVEDVCG
jgi:hypothetical protein